MLESVGEAKFRTLTHPEPSDSDQYDIIMAALCNRGPLYFCPVISIFYLFIYLSFFPCLISAAAGWISTIL